MPISYDHKAIVPRTTILQMATAWSHLKTTVERCCTEIIEAQKAANVAFDFGEEGSHYEAFNFDDILRYRQGDIDRPETIVDQMRRRAWGAIFHKVNLRRLMGEADVRKLDENLAQGTLPEITMEAVLGVLADQADRAPQFLDRSVQEVFDWLTPQRGYYATNRREAIGPRVVISWACESGWGVKGRFRIRHNSEARFRQLDNVFSLLDGKGTVPSHYGPLYDAVAESITGHGDTEYFEFRCHKNGNMHLRFKRLDLLEKLNAIAGGNHLASGTEPKVAPAHA